MLAIFVVIVLTYFSTTLFGFLVHKALHQKWTGKYNKAHMTHHLKLYPPDDFTSDIYRDPGKDNTVLIFAVSGIPLFVSPIILYCLGTLSLSLMIICLIEMAIVGLLHDRIHDSFHIKNHWFNHIPIVGSWFQGWKKLHYLHHIRMQKNLGIFEFYWDKFFKTFLKD